MNAPVELDRDRLRVLLAALDARMRERGVGEIAYIVLWVLMPRADRSLIHRVATSPTYVATVGARRREAVKR